MKNQANNVEVSVSKHMSKPSEVENAPGKAYSYLSFDVSNLNESNVEEAKIQFTVNKSWIQENNIDPTKVFLNRYDGEWNQLETTKVSESETEITYEAKTPGFSYFAVTGEEKTEEPATTTTVEEEETTTTVKAEEPAEPSFWDTWKIPIIVIVAIVLIAVFFLLQRK